MYNPFSTNLKEVERDLEGNWFYWMLGDSSTSKFKSELHKLNTVLSSPAVLKVFKLQCDMVSLGKIEARNEKGELIDNDPLVKLIQKPNYFQSDNQFLWTYMFWRMMGTANLTTTSKVLKETTYLYWLNPAQLIWTDSLIKKLDRIVLSNKSHKDILESTIYYSNLDGTKTPYKLKDITPFFDLTNGLGNWYKGNSSIDALYKIIQNSETVLDSKGINYEFAGKYMVSGQHSENDLMNTPMGETEKISIESSVRGNKPVHAVKTMIDIKRFVDNLNKLNLDTAYYSDVYKIGNMFSIPKYVLEAGIDEGATYENQKWSKPSWIEQSIKPSTDDLIRGIEMMFGLEDDGVFRTITFDHLSFMKIFETQKQDAIALELTNLSTAKEMGAINESDLKKRVLNLIGDE